MSKINWKTRKSYTAEKVCAWFRDNRNEDLTFGEILDKYCELGMSRAAVTRLLTRVMNNKIILRPTAVWDAWQIERANGRTGFIFHSKFTGNRYHGNRGIIRKIKKIEGTTVDLYNQEIKYYCTKCNSLSWNKSNITEAPKRLIGLKSYRCKTCGEFGTCIAKFILDDEIVYKKIIEGRECFAEFEEEKLIIIERRESANG